ncbi:hypothetical protein H0I31_12790 [Tenacibaculum sp. AHE15PA]|uniref:hypothetical protein n=1 Tax=unclassified Tenacibaculum TaxID=2635139 RepID=UPI001C4F88FC|nr:MULTISPECIES: hypothetical protein [unclassified Tenacibaculum]QXP73592.1 hypothetical protein H0I30_00190 [Tenacibaculum sp. AHE14PA]QXP76039.1 hypothetical protein H0I31_12790 [Tenacibaculum sp. AHE15PA]
MKRILLLVLLVTTIAQSQVKTFENEVQKISRKIDKITKEQKDSLKVKIKEINFKLTENELTNTQATSLKKEAAVYHASQIEKHVSFQEQILQQLVQDKTEGKVVSNDDVDEKNTFKIGGATFKLSLSEKGKKKRKYRKSKRTTTQFVFAMGVNNVLTNNEFNSLNNSDYKFWQSHFYEVGFTWKTRISKQPSKTYFKYGLSFLWNNLRAENNMYHSVNGNETVLIEHPNKLSESRLRHVQMTFPMHLEFDLSKNKKYADNKVVDRTHKAVRIGLGGFFGFKLGTRQYLEYKNAEGVNVEELQKASFNTNTINYGLSAYFAYKSCGLYAKYDLNPLFKNTETRNLSLGLRFDIN